MKKSIISVAAAASLLVATAQGMAAGNQARERQGWEYNTREDPVTLETVTVTAGKTEADKQELPVSVSAFGAATLEDLAMDNLSEVVTISPNINFNKMDSHTMQYTFRGIGGTANMNKVYYVNLDDVAIPYVATDTLLDVERVELLRGGQGALYGRNTHTGLINVVTREPEFSPFSADARVSYEEFDTRRLSVAMGGAAGETTAWRAALAYKGTDGYFENIYLNRDDSNDSD